MNACIAKPEAGGRVDVGKSEAIVAGHVQVLPIHADNLLGVLDYGLSLRAVVGPEIDAEMRCLSLQPVVQVAEKVSGVDGRQLLPVAEEDNLLNVRPLQQQAKYLEEKPQCIALRKIGGGLAVLN